MMLPARSASAFSHLWRRRAKIACFSRALSRLPETESLQEDLAKVPPSTVESLFGIAPLKAEALEEEESVSESLHLKKKDSEPVPESSAAEKDSIFTKAWELQKKQPLPLIEKGASPSVEGLLSKIQPAGPTVDPVWELAQEHNRVWLHAPDAPVITGERFTIASYNILAVTYAITYRRNLYADVPAIYLDWKNRRKKIMIELGLCSPDIICLQVVDRFHDIQKDLAQMGYTGLFKARTGPAPDGCATFWKEDRFKLLHEESIEFVKFGMANNVAQVCVLQSITPECSEEESISQASNGGQGQKRLLVGNINVLFNPKRGDRKLGQCRVFLDHVHKLSRSWSNAPVVIGGCFNFTPSSAIYQFLAKGELDVSGMDRSYMSGQVPMPSNNVNPPRTSRSGTSQSLQDVLKKTLGARFAAKGTNVGDEGVNQQHEDSSVCDAASHEPSEKVKDPGKTSPVAHQWKLEELEVATGQTDCKVLQHKFNLLSVYPEIKGRDGTRDAQGEPLATAYHRDFRGTVDYIWRSDGLKAVKVLDPVPLEMLLRTQGLPSKVWGSDHIALASELAFT